MAQSRIDGKYGILYKYVADTTNDYVVVSCARTNSFSSSATVNEGEVNKCDPETVTKNYGGINQSVDFEGHIISQADIQSYFELLADQESQTKVVFKYDFDTNNPDTHVRYFTAVIADLDADQEVNIDSTWTMSLEIDGKSSTVDPMV